MLESPATIAYCLQEHHRNVPDLSPFAVKGVIAMSRILTVNGEIDSSRAGFTLPHEHVMTDFAGADRATRDRYDRDSVIEVMLPHLNDAKRSGVETFIECTPMGLGRDVILLRELAERTGLNIVTNTGQYKGIHVPSASMGMSAEEIAREWIGEFANGIEGTGIRPGFIKTAVDTGDLTEMETRLLTAAALCSTETGMAIATHCGPVGKGRKVLDLLRKYSVPPEKWILVHAQAEEDADALAAFAATGVWIELDGLGWGMDDRHEAYALRLIRDGFADRILLSHDAGWYHVGEPGGGTQKPFTVLSDTFLPRLRAIGVSDTDIERITVENPAHAFAIV